LHINVKSLTKSSTKVSFKKNISDSANNHIYNFLINNYTTIEKERQILKIGIILPYKNSKIN
jgi:hypothetical protein